MSQLVMEPIDRSFEFEALPPWAATPVASPDPVAPRGVARAGGQVTPRVLPKTTGPAVRPRSFPDVPPARRRCEPSRAGDRRRSVVVATVAAILVALLASPLLGQPRSGTTPASGGLPAPLAAHTWYVVQPGDTLWTIAGRMDSSMDPRPIVAVLAQEAGGEQLVPGERLYLP